MSGDNRVWMLRGTVSPGRGWASAEWAQVVAAHRIDLPDIGDYFRGTLNVVLAEPWSPPDDERYRRVSHERGKARGGGALGSGILLNGNYLHPEVEVLSINGRRIEGRLYFPGIPATRWSGDDAVWGTLAPVGRIEIIAKARLRDLLGIGPDEEGDVEVELGRGRRREAGTKA